MKPNSKVVIIFSVLVVLSLACSLSPLSLASEKTVAPTEVAAPSPTPILEMPVQSGEENPDEPVIISGTIPFTSPFFLDGNAEPFVLLEDEAGFAARDLEFEFPLAGQAIGPVELVDDNTLSFNLSLPAVPQGTLLDVDNNGEEDRGVMVFAMAYWSNTWGDPFLEPRDGRGWSTAYVSTTTDPDRDNEIDGGHLIIWAPDDSQQFPSGYGEDNMLLTEDDPVQSVPAGYSIVDLDTTPFKIYKEAQPIFELIEGEGAVNNYTDLSYEEAFDAMFKKVSVEYPFTEEKNIDWDALYDEFAPRIREARNDNDFYRALRDFTYRIPDGHVGISFNADVFYEEQGGSFGMLLSELSDGRILVKKVLPNTAASKAGIQPGAEILQWDGQPVRTALDAVVPYLGPFSTEHTKRLEQLVFLTRNPIGTKVAISYKNPTGGEVNTTLTSEFEYDSLFESIPSLNLDELVLPIEAEVLDESGLGYIRITTFSEDYNLMARLWERAIEGLLDYDIPGLIIDVRINGGGNMGLAMDFVGYFFYRELAVSQSSYYNERTGVFEYTDYPSRIEPAPIYYDGPIAVLISPDCVSACEGFSNAMSQEERAVIVGHFPSAGAYGEVGRGQYELPGDFSMQFPTGRPETMDGEILIEGTGVVPTYTVPVTEESALGIRDTVLETAVQTLLDQIN